MIKQTDPHIFQGMRKDKHPIKQDEKFLYDAHNIRFLDYNGGTQLSIGNERGPKYIRYPKRDSEGNVVTSNGKIIYRGITISGIYIGHCAFNDFVVVFSTGAISDDGNNPGIDKITKVYINNYGEWDIKTLFEGDLNLSASHKLETLGVYESEDVMKVYWVDGVNPPRMLIVDRIKPNDNILKPYTKFDFTQELKLNEEITVDRIEGSGMFSPGVIQYAFCYYNLYGQQSNIFHTTPLNYISFIERGGKEDEYIANSFSITVNNIDTSFDFLRIYSIHRTALNVTPSVKRVVDLKIDTDTASFTYIDDGNNGDAVDPMELYYIGGESIIANTITSKDNILFLGNINLNRMEPLSEFTVGNYDEDEAGDIQYHIEVEQGSKVVNTDVHSSDYRYDLELKNPITGFKNREHYRLGIQFQHKSGKWSNPVFLKDYTVSSDYNPDLIIDNGGETVKVLNISAKLYLNRYNDLKEWGYVKVRPVCVFPEMKDRLVLTQGILCPTVYNYSDREKSAPYAQSSWFFRMNPPSGTGLDSLLSFDPEGGYPVEYRHNYPLLPNTELMTGVVTYDTISDNVTTTHNISIDPDQDDGSGISGDVTATSLTSKIAALKSHNAIDPLFCIDRSIVTMHSPEIEFNTDLRYMKNYNWKMRIVGKSLFNAVYGDIDIQTSTPPAVTNQGLQDYTINNIVYSITGGAESMRGMAFGKFWKDGFIFTDRTNNKYLTATNIQDYNVHAWNKTGSLNNDTKRTDGSLRTAELKSKKIGNFRFSNRTSWLSNPLSYHISKIEPVDDNELTYHKIENAYAAGASVGSFSYQNISYYGNVERGIMIGNIENDISGTNIHTIMGTGIQIVNAGTTDGTQVVGDILEEENAFVMMSYKSTSHLVFSMNALQLPENLNTANTDNYVNGNNSNIEDCITVEYAYTGHSPNTTGNQSGSSIDWLRKWFYSSDKPWSEENQNYTAPVYNSGTNTFSGTYIGKYFIARKDRSDNAVAYGDNLMKEEIVELYRISAYSVENTAKYKYDAVFLDDPEIKINNDYRDVLWRFARYIDGASRNFEWRFKFINTPNTQCELVYSEETENSYDHQQNSGQQVQQTQENEPNLPYLFLGELYRSPLATDFGGLTDDALLHNIWIPAGEAVPLDAINDGSITVKYTHGDTWYQRYECLKTYPFTDEAENSVIEVASFLCETRINADGRSDRNRTNLQNLLNFNPNNFNLMNMAYSQRDNFFSYNMMREQDYETDSFPNQITYTRVKSPAQEIDNWTNITLANVIDTDGRKGEVRKLVTFNDTVYCFQDTSVSRIRFNSRVQIPVSDGVPVEIANSAKYDGMNTVPGMEHVGCTNKWSVCVTNAGVYFIDSVSGNLYSIGGEAPSNISVLKEMNSWFSSVENRNDESTFYDFIRNDLYLVWKDNTCLNYSEKLGEFTSFLNYEKADALFNIGEKFYAFHTEKNNTQNFNMYEMFAGHYNRFFGSNYKYGSSISFISQPYSASDKLFTNLDARTDFFVKTPSGWPMDTDNEDEQLVHDKFFDYIRVSNEYQDTGKCSIDTGYVSGMKHGVSARKKFRIWRMDIPRAESDYTGIHKLDRIRNPWAMIELGTELEESSSTQMKSVSELLEMIENEELPADFEINAYYEGLLDLPENEEPAADEGEESDDNTQDTEQEDESSGLTDVSVTPKLINTRFVLHDLDVTYYVF